MVQVFFLIMPHKAIAYKRAKMAPATIKTVGDKATVEA
jgi:hypothetical protein